MQVVIAYNYPAGALPAGILSYRSEQIYMDNSYKSSSSSQQKFKVIFNSPVVVSFSGICLAAMLLDYLTGGWSTATFFLPMNRHGSIR